MPICLATLVNDFAESAVSRIWSPSLPKSNLPSHSIQTLIEGLFFLIGRRIRLCT
jgi:hypothetical protein